MSNEKKSWSWEKRHEDWTVIMDIYSPPCGAVFQDHLHQKYQLLIKNADSSSHPRPTDFYFLGLDCRNLYFEQVLEHTNVLGKTLPKCKCKSYLQRHKLNVSNLSFLWVQFWKWYFILKTLLGRKRSLRE